MNTGTIRLAGVELGGTKAIVVSGEPGAIERMERVPVTAPRETLAAIAAILSAWHRDQPIGALGIASFGPVGIIPGTPSYGRMLHTPKPGWSDVELVERLGSTIGGPVAIHTDVTAAALAEGSIGAALGLSDHVYMTIGTGIGIGIVAGGTPLIGQMHPEGGHMLVRQIAGDSFEGNCPFHGPCFEGLASGPAIAARLGQKGQDIPDDHPVWDYVIDAIAEASANLFMTLSSQAIVLGGGVINERTWMVERVATLCARKLGGYLPFVGDAAPIHAAALGDEAGPNGALLLAKSAI